jgi:tagatose-1,6-bisphosphate aldolase
MSLAEISDARGRFAVLAVDHRDSLRAFLAPDDPESLTPSEITNLKIEMAKAISPLATGVMLEPEYSIPQVIDAQALADGVGFLAALESQGYLGRVGESPTTLLDGWSVEQAKASGASAAKLLLHYHPDKPLATAQQRVGAEVAAECRRVGIPLILEPLFYGLEDPADRPRIVMETAATFTSVGADLLKLPFPVDIASDPDDEHWFASCRVISETVSQPWTLLSGGGSFDDFARQLTVAMAAGCHGFMVGRALWGEAARAEPEERSALLAGEITRRFAQLRDIVESAERAS